jgi:cyanophycinase-like exopeptidase
VALGTACFALGGAACTSTAPTRRGPGYRHYLAGNAADVVTPTRGLVVLQGGGDDVDENYIRMGSAGGGGDFVVLRASGADDYNEYIFRLCHCDSVETIVFESRAAAEDPFVVATIRNAEAIFIAGGDQSRYVRFWKDSPVEDAINFVAAKPAPIGGTSAGMAIMGEFVYSAKGKHSLTSAAALTDPFAPDLTLERGFLALPRLAGVLTDQHVGERDRIGRTVALLARIQRDGWDAEPRAIAADRETALHVDPSSGTAEVFATRDHAAPYVYFLAPKRVPARCEPGEPLSTDLIATYRLAPGGRFHIDTWRGSGGLAYAIRVEAGELRSSRGEVY